MASACRPVSYFWTQFSGAEGKCVNINGFFLATGVINMVNDFVILIIPFHRIVKLQMSPHKKLAICGIMAVGIFVCVSSIVRIYFLSVFMSAVDVTWLMGLVFIWSTIEPAVASLSTSLHSQKYSAIASGKQGPRRSALFSNRGPTLDYGLDGVRKNTDDDEIGLTNYVTVENSAKDPSIESFHGGHDHSIAVRWTFVQTTSRRSDV